MAKWICMVCRYVYDEADGDFEQSVEPGTPFAEISDDFVCPACGVGKSQFMKLSDE